jgi:uncharacterized RDD family membrane protein YckC
MGITWWYLDNKKVKSGPVEPEELKRLLQSGRIGLQNLVWHEGMDDWRAVSELDELKEFQAAIPPPLPTKENLDPLSFPLATSWPRFFARVFDLWWEVLLVAFVLGAILGTYSAAFVEWLNGPGGSNVFAILCVPLALIVDAAVRQVAGNTPGKAMLGLRVGTLAGKQLSFAEYLGRNFSLWLSGLALGMPLINLFTMARQSERIRKGLSASYDESSGFRVRARPSGLVRKTAFGVAFIGLLVVMAALNAMEQKAQSEAFERAAQKNFSWENPHTGVTAVVDSKWSHSTQKNEDGSEVYMFAESADRAVVIIAAEEAPGFTMNDYVRAFLTNTGTNNSMRFSDGGTFFERGGLSIWQGAGTVPGGAANRLQVKVIQVGSTFWRVVNVQTRPYDYSDVSVGQLSNALWRTVIGATVPI